MIRVIGPKDKKVGNVINVTTSSASYGRQLSPMLLGPVNLYNGHTSKNVENAWQYSKVYSEFVDIGKNPTDEYFAWRHQGWRKTWADRYPMGKNRQPLYSLWDGQKLGYIEARKQIYIPLYKQAVINTEAFSLLKEEKDLVIFDYDGYDYLKLGMTLTDVLNCSSKKMGHGFVLAMILEGIV